MAAAWAVWKASGAHNFQAGVYQAEPPWGAIDASETTILVDFSYKRPVMEQIIQRCPGEVLVLDHHKTAQDDLLPLLEAGALRGQFDMNRCGAMMAWDWFHPDQPPPTLMLAIDAQDRWLPHRDPKLIMALRSYPHAATDRLPWDDLMRLWSEFMTDKGLHRLHKDGEAIFRYYRARVEETKPHAAPSQIGPYENVPLVNAPFYLASDVAGELAEESPHGIAAVWWRNKDGGAKFSLRSRGDVDVGALCATLGGGGHPGAAGFKLDAGQLIRFLQSDTVQTHGSEGDASNDT